MNPQGTPLLSLRGSHWEDASLRLLVFPLLRTQSQEGKESTEDKAVVKGTALYQALNQGTVQILPRHSNHTSSLLLFRQGTIDKSLLETRQVCAATAGDWSAAMAGRGTAKASVRVRRTSSSIYGSDKTRGGVPLFIPQWGNKATYSMLLSC